METKSWALVTGASSGIGWEYAKILASKSYQLLIVSNEAEKLEGKAAELRAEYQIQVISLYMDLSTEDAAVKLHDYCKTEDLQVDVLINNAGIFYFGEVNSQSPAHISKTLRLHVQTPTLLCRFFGEDMKARGKGYILNMSSLAAWLAYPGIALYASTKAYLKYFSKAFRSEMMEYGVSVTTLCPGAVATDLYNLSHKLQRLAIRLGVMMRPERLAQKAIRAMFRRRARVMPGLINHIFLPLARVLPSRLIRKLMIVTGFLPLS